MRKILALILSIIFIFITGFTSLQIYKYESITISFRYFIIAIYILISLLILIRFWKTQNKRIKKKMDIKTKKRIKRQRLSSICLMLVFCIVLSYGNHLYYQVDETLETITNVDLTEEEIQCYIYAMKDSNITSLNNINSRYFGLLTREDGSIKMPLSAYLEDQTKQSSDSINFLSYPTAVDLYVALADNQVDYIAVSEDEVQNLKDYNEDFTRTTKLIAQVALTSSATSDPVNVTSEPFNVLLLGTDIRESEGTIQSDSRSDTIMVASFNPQTMQISLISIPRDSYVPINGGTEDKINHSGNLGTSVMINTVEDLLDININYFVKINFKALVDIVDAIGGINIHVDYAFCEQDSNDTPDAICLEEGQQNLNGEQALAYARHRKTVSDHIRNNAQQQVIQGITNRLTSISVVTNFNSLLNVVSSNMITNFSKKELYSLAGLAPNLGQLQYHNMVIQGTDDMLYMPQYDQELSVTYLDDASILEAKQMIESIHNGQ